MLEKVQAAPPVAPKSIPVPAPLEDVWKKCMWMDPDDRYPDARAVASEVAAWLEGSLARDKAMGLVDEARQMLEVHTDTKARAMRARNGRERRSPFAPRPTSRPKRPPSPRRCGQGTPGRSQQPVVRHLHQVSTRHGPGTGSPEARNSRQSLPGPCRRGRDRR